MHCIYFLETSILPYVKDFTEDVRAWLLILGQHLASEQRIAESRFASVEIASDKNFARVVFNTLNKSKQVPHTLADLPIKERSDRRFLE